MVQAGFIGSQLLTERGSDTEALQLLQRYFSIEASMENEELEAIAKRARVPMGWLHPAYRLLATLLFNDALRMAQQFEASTRPRPALRWRALGQLDKAEGAFLISRRAAPDGTPDEGFTEVCDQLRDLLQRD